MGKVSCFSPPIYNLEKKCQLKLVSQRPFLGDMPPSEIWPSRKHSGSLHRFKLENHEASAKVKILQVFVNIYSYLLYQNSSLWPRAKILRRESICSKNKSNEWLFLKK